MSVSKGDKQDTLQNFSENQDDPWCDDELLSQAYDVYISQSKPTVLMHVLPISTTKEDAACSSHVEKRKKRDNDSTTLLDHVGDYSVESESVVISTKQKMEKQERIEESENESLFEGYFSDQDPSYLPNHLDRSTTPQSDDSELIQLDELLNPDRYISKREQINEMRRKAIVTLFGKSKQCLSDNESQYVAQAVMADIFKLTWKVIQPRARWSRRDPATWKKNLVKRRRAEGLPYVTKTKYRDPKLPKPINCSKCKFECNSHVTEIIRKELCRKYWNLEYKSKKQFILSLIEIKPTKRILLNRKRTTQRKYTKQCFFIIEGERRNVCQDFFCRTLSISPHVIADAIKHRDSFGQFSIEEDPRGRREPPNKTSVEVIEAIKKHIASFPSMESHYVRKKLKRRYLDAGLTLSKMYALYVAECKNKNGEPVVSEMTYRRIFSTEFNLGFFMPKKDQCLLCTKFKRANGEEKENILKEYDEHIQRKETCNREKQKDKQRAEKEKDFLTVSFDLQAILQIPCTDVGLLYYTRKLTLYNLTIYENVLPNEAYCFAWNEVNGKKGSAEIGTILHHYLTTCVPKEIKEVSLFSDTCGGQNRNQYIAAILLWIMMQDTHLEIIEHKFLESGHSYMEADSMHSAIETAKKNYDIYCMTDWVNVFKRARSKQVYKCEGKKIAKKAYHVKEFKYNEFKDLKALAETVIINRSRNTEGEKVNWLKIKRMKYIKGNNNIYYNYDMSNNFMVLDVTASTTTDIGRKTTALSTYPNHGYSTRNKRKQQVEVDEMLVQPSNSEPIFPPLKQLYSGPLPISVAKKKDLINLCNKGVIPEEYHGWFQSLPTEACSVDRLPDATLSDSDETCSLSSLEN